jgi:hypothetical protein
MTSRFCCVYDEASQEKLVCKQASQCSFKYDDDVVLHTSFFRRWISRKNSSSHLPKDEFSRHFSSAICAHGPVDCGILLSVNKDPSAVGELISMLMVTVQRVSLCMRE